MLMDDIIYYSKNETTIEKSNSHMIDSNEKNIGRVLQDVDCFYSIGWMYPNLRLHSQILRKGCM